MVGLGNYCISHKDYKTTWIILLSQLKLYNNVFASFPNFLIKLIYFQYKLEKEEYLKGIVGIKTKLRLRVNSKRQLKFNWFNKEVTSVGLQFW